jgi:hypothetical protein
MKSNRHAEAHPELHPPSMRSSGTELDRECYPAGGGGVPQAAGGLGLDAAAKLLRSGNKIPQAEAGTGLDSAIRQIDGGQN